MKPTPRTFALLGAVGALLGSILGEFLIPRPTPRATIPQPAAVALVIDASGSMNEQNKLAEVKRTAQDFVARQDLQITQIAVVGFGSQALDHPKHVQKLAVLDIAPTPYVFAHLSRELALAYYHWFFLAQPPGFPERLIAGDPVGFLHQKLGGWGRGLSVYAPEALAEYERCFRDPATIQATCEDYRAAASIDLEHYAADTRTIEGPLLALWDRKGIVHRTCDVLSAWREYAPSMQGQALEAGHFLCEENPAETTQALLSFLRG